MLFRSTILAARGGKFRSYVRSGGIAQDPPTRRIGDQRGILEERRARDLERRAQLLELLRHLLRRGGDRDEHHLGFGIGDLQQRRAAKVCDARIEGKPKHFGSVQAAVDAVTVTASGDCELTVSWPAIAADGQASYDVYRAASCPATRC